MDYLDHLSKKYNAFKYESIREVRLKKGFTQEQLAEKSGIKQQHLTQVETGKIRPTLKTSRALAKALDVDPLDLMLGQILENREIKKKERKDTIARYLDIGKDVMAFNDINQVLR